MQLNKGFTLVETLVSVMIMVILITMAVPMYQRTVEKSRVAEVGMVLKRMGEAKLRAMDNRDIADYQSGDLTIGELDSHFPSSQDFTFYLFPNSYHNGVCAVRARGKQAGTVFLFLGETAAEYCSCPNADTTTVCGAYCTTGRKLFCKDNSAGGSCEVYGLDSYSSVGTCSSN